MDNPELGRKVLDHLAEHPEQFDRAAADLQAAADAIAAAQAALAAMDKQEPYCTVCGEPVLHLMAGWTHISSVDHIEARQAGHEPELDWRPVGAGGKGNDAAVCRHCGNGIVRCEPQHEVPVCKGWKHAEWLSMPIGAHYCGGRSVNPSAEPATRETGEGNGGG